MSVLDRNLGRLLVGRFGCLYREVSVPLSARDLSHRASRALLWCRKAYWRCVDWIGGAVRSGGIDRKVLGVCCFKAWISKKG